MDPDDRQKLIDTHYDSILQAWNELQERDPDAEPTMLLEGLRRGTPPLERVGTRIRAIEELEGEELNTAQKAIIEAAVLDNTGWLDTLEEMMVGRDQVPVQYVRKLLQEHDALLAESTREIARNRQETRQVIEHCNTEKENLRQQINRLEGVLASVLKDADPEDESTEIDSDDSDNRRPLFARAQQTQGFVEGLVQPMSPERSARQTAHQSPSQRSGSSRQREIVTRFMEDKKLTEARCQELERKLSQIATERRICKETKSEAIQLRGMLTDLEDQNDRYRTRIKNLENLVGWIKGTGESTGKQPNGHLQIQMLNEEVESLSAQMEQDREKIQGLRIANTVAACRDLPSSRRPESPEERSNKKLVELLEREVARLRELVGQLTADSEKRGAVFIDAIRKKGLVEREAAKSQKQAAEAEKALGSLREEHEDMESQRLNLQQELKAAKEYHDQSTKKLAEALERHLYQGNGVLSDAAKQDIKQTVEQVANPNDSTRRKLLTQYTRLERDLEANAAESRRLQDCVDVLSKQKAAAELELDVRDGEFDAANVKVVELEVAVESLRHQLDQKTILLATQSEIAKTATKLQMEVANLRAQLRDAITGKGPYLPHAEFHFEMAGDIRAHLSSLLAAIDSSETPQLAVRPAIHQVSFRLAQRQHLLQAITEAQATGNWEPARRVRAAFDPELELFSRGRSGVPDLHMREDSALMAYYCALIELKANNNVDGARAMIEFANECVEPGPATIGRNWTWIRDFGSLIEGLCDKTAPAPLKCGCKFQVRRLDNQGEAGAAVASLEHIEPCAKHAALAARSGDSPTTSTLMGEGGS